MPPDHHDDERPRGASTSPTAESSHAPPRSRRLQIDGSQVDAINVIVCLGPGVFVSVTSSTGVDARPDDLEAAAAQQLALALVENVERVVRGRRDTVELVAVALLSGGHVLVDDVPGSGKTTLARASRGPSGAASAASRARRT